jgi:Fe2+ or Zn2+ uptake regulation protein
MGNWCCNTDTYDYNYHSISNQTKLPYHQKRERILHIFQSVKVKRWYTAQEITQWADLNDVSAVEIEQLLYNMTDQGVLQSKLTTDGRYIYSLVKDNYDTAVIKDTTSKVHYQPPFTRVSP